MSENLPITWEELRDAMEFPHSGTNTSGQRFISESPIESPSELKWPDFDSKEGGGCTLSDTALFGLTSAAENDKNVIRKMYYQIINVTLSSKEGNDWLRDAMNEMKKGKIDLARYKVKQCVNLILATPKRSDDFILRNTIEEWGKIYPVLEQITIPTTNQMYLPKSSSQNISEGVTEEALKNKETLKKYIEETLIQSIETGPIALLTEVQNTIKNV